MRPRGGTRPAGPEQQRVRNQYRRQSRPAPERAPARCAAPAEVPGPQGRNSTVSENNSTAKPSGSERDPRLWRAPAEGPVRRTGTARERKNSYSFSAIAACAAASRATGTRYGEHDT
jgi:hypothetical protein